jgi:hypothetical protein
MRYILLSEQKKLFQRCGSIAFEGLWNHEQVANIHNALQNVLVMRLGIIHAALPQATAEQCYSVGRDVWRSNTLLKKSVTSESLAELATELFDRRPLRLAYDQYLLPWREMSSRRGVELPLYNQLVQKCETLEATSSIQGILGGVILCLEAPVIVPESEETAVVDEQIVAWPKQAGDGVFFKAQAKIDFTYLQRPHCGSYLMITYCRNDSVYIMQPGDPQVHALKHMGYVFGDRLSDKLHPIVIR